MEKYSRSHGGGGGNKLEAAVGSILNVLVL